MPTQIHTRQLMRTAIGLLLATTVLLVQPVAAQNMDRTGTLWAPYLEWTLDNPSFAGNPFDLIASVKFTHLATGASHTTQMFHAGGTKWNFRFTGTKTGIWSFQSTSADPELNGHTGTVTINKNPNAAITGFLTSFNNKFAKQFGENGEIKTFIFNVYMNEIDYDQNGKLGTFDTTKISNYLNNAQSMGFDIIFLNVLNNWFNINAMTYTQHNSTDPDIKTFERLEEIITTAHARGMHVHLWAWGDEDRKWTQIGVPGGINGTADKRLQRYIASRLGPLPGWSMGYGFDLNEWVTIAQLNEWASYLKTHSGWPMMLGGRRNELEGGGSSMGYSSHGSPDKGWFYDDAVNFMDSNTSRPHLLSERDLYLRFANSDMVNTRRKMWQYAMAGGLGGWWGLRFDNNTPYPNPEQIDNHRIFWQVNSRLLLDMARANSLSNGYALKNSANTHFIFYKENTNTISLNLSSMASAQRAIAVDTTKPYLEIDLGLLNPINQTWPAPTTSDWAIAIGTFSTAPTVVDTIPPAPPQNLKATVIENSGNP